MSAQRRDLLALLEVLELLRHAGATLTTLETRCYTLGIARGELGKLRTALCDVHTTICAERRKLLKSSGDAGQG